MRRDSSYLFERHYSDMEKQEETTSLKVYWKNLLGQDVYETMQKNCRNFNCYLDQKMYVKSDNKEVVAFMEYIDGARDNDSRDCNKNRKETIYFETFYRIPVAYGRKMLTDRLKKEFSGEEFLREFEDQLVERLQRICLRTLIVRMHDFEQEGCLKGKDATGKYHYFCKEILIKKGFLIEIFDEYPVLCRCVVGTIKKFVSYYAEIVMHFQKDRESIRQILCKGQSFQRIQKVTGDFSDSHNNGKQVARIYLDNDISILYKPRSMENEEIYVELLQWLSGETQISQYEYPFLSYSDHSWSSIVEHRACNSQVELKEYYLRLGVQLFLVSFLGTKDLHCENIIAAGEYPVLIDLETLSNIRYNQKRATAKEEIKYQLSQSVLYTGLLPFYSWNHDGKGTNISGICGQGGQIYPFKIPTIIDGGTSDMHIEYRNPLSEKNLNLATVKGVFYTPLLYLGELKRGFCSAYRTVMEKKEEFCQILQRVEGTKSRYVVADTQRYGMLLSSSYHPSLLMDGAAREVFLYSMWKGRGKHEKGIVESEVKELLNGDIPYFYHYMNSKSIMNIRGEDMKDYFDEMPMNILYQKLKSLSIQDMERQCEYMDWVLEATFNHKERYFNTVHEVKSTELTYVNGGKSISQNIRMLTGHLLNHAVWNQDHTEVSWYTFQFSTYGGHTWDVKPMNMYLYDGLAGMLLLLHELQNTDGRKEISEMYRAVKNMLFQYTDDISQNPLPVKDMPVGACSGESSIVFTYLRLYQSGKEEYLEYAIKHACIVGELVDFDLKYDFISGNAGAAQVMLLLYKTVQDKKYLEIAERAVMRLKEAAKEQIDGIGWEVEKGIPPMAGMAHGNSGILLPVIQLWMLTGKEKYEQLAERIWSYEESLYRPELNNWEDMRVQGEYHDDVGAMAWCHGAPGILLSRIMVYPMVEDVKWKRRFDRDILRAYNKVETYWNRDSLCICHGNCGNLWILDMASRFLKKRGTGYKANLMNGEIRLLQQEKFNPGLFSGYGGILYYLIKDGDLSRILDFYGE